MRTTQKERDAELQCYRKLYGSQENPSLPQDDPNNTPISPQTEYKPPYDQNPLQLNEVTRAYALSLQQCPYIGDLHAILTSDDVEKIR